MKTILFSLLIFLTLPCWSQVQLTTKKKQYQWQQTNEEEEENLMAGKWQEFKRTTLQRGGSEKDIPFNDTLKLMLGEDSLVYQYKEDAKISYTEYGFVGNKFFFDSDKTLLDFSLDEDVMRIGGPKEYSYLRMVSEFYFAPIKKRIPSETTGAVGVVDEKFLAGNWKVYKKTDPEFSRSKEYLYRLEIMHRTADAFYAIQVTYDNAGKLVSDTGTLVLTDQQCMISALNQQKTYSINKAFEDEFILQDGEVVYFLKK